MIEGDDFVLLNAYRDGELSPGEAIAMERRLAAEPALRAEADRLAALSGALKASLAMPPAPPALRAQIVQRIGFSEPPRRPWRQTWQALAAVLMVGVIGGGLVGGGATYVGLTRSDDGEADMVAAGHLRGLAAGQPFDIASSNHHVVKPWFNGRTTIAPQTPDLAAQGFPLAGGRIDIVGGRPVPTLVYRHDQHVISVTVLPGTREGAAEESRAGSRMLRWTEGGLTYWAVSDLDPNELNRFVHLFRNDAPT